MLRMHASDNEQPPTIAPKESTVGFPTASIIRAEVGGDCFPGETWQTGVDLLVIGTPNPPQPGELDAIANDVIAKFRSAVWNDGTSADLESFNDSSVNLKAAKVSYYQGAVLLGTGVGSTAVTAGSGTATHPGYTSCAVQTLTPLATRRGRGRRYLPLTAGGVDLVDGQFSAALCTGLATKYAAFLALMNLSSGVIGGASYALEARLISEAATQTYEIIAARVDSRPDVQRGRVRSTAPLRSATASV